MALNLINHRNVYLFTQSVFISNYWKGERDYKTYTIQSLPPKCLEFCKGQFKNQSLVYNLAISLLTQIVICSTHFKKVYIRYIWSPWAHYVYNRKAAMMTIEILQFKKRETLQYRFYNEILVLMESLWKRHAKSPAFVLPATTTKKDFKNEIFLLILIWQAWNSNIITKKWMDKKVNECLYMFSLLENRTSQALLLQNSFFTESYSVFCFCFSFQSWKLLLNLHICPCLSWVSSLRTNFLFIASVKPIQIMK